MIKRIISIICLFVFTQIGFSQQLNLSNLSSVNIDNVSDEQVEAFVEKFTKAGYDIADVDKIASAKGMSPAQIEKLKQRIQKISQKAPTTEVSNEQMNRKMTIVEQGNREEEYKLDQEASTVFGTKLFRRNKVGFAPSPNIATPKTYQLGPGDELNIYVYGYSETNITTRVATDGTIRIPNVGLMQVSGMSIENAESAIKKKLSTIYSSIRSGQTKVSISLTNMRSVMVYILGEVDNPGSYTLSSLSSVLNALYACGGPSPKTGSMRNIKVLRNNKEIAIVDIYELLLKGKLSNNITLQDQDVIYIPTYTSHVTINGALLHNGIFEIKDGETLSDLISFCGGFSDDAYKDRISLIRKTGKEKSIADIPEDLYPIFKLQAGDEYTVSQKIDKFKNRVQIVGGVQRPGSYALTEGMTLKDLIKKADGLVENVYMEIATISRLKEDLTPEIISFKIKDLIDGSYNISLKKEDIVTIGSKSDFEERKNIRIEGEIMQSGSYPYSENITLKELIFMAKGLSQYADYNNIEITRTITNSEILNESSEKAEIFILSIDSTMSGGDANFKLMPNDVVSVRSISGIMDLGSIEVRGEIKSPGVYAITSKIEHISDIIKRAGGFTQYAYLQGAFLIRRSNRTEAELKRDLKLIDALNSVTDGDEKEALRKSILARTDMVGIKLDEIAKKVRSKTDLIVHNGDIIYIPKQLQTVSVSGAVQVPSMVIFDNHKFKEYVNSVGGFTENADKKHSYVAYSNGSIKGTKKFLWIKRYPKVEPGAHIFIPEKPIKESHAKENATFAVALLGSMATIAATITSIVILSKK